MQISVLNYDDYRSFLRDSLEEKARKNPSFSLRAFARSTGLSASHLSRTLSGKKKLSVSSAHLISAGLGLNAGETVHLQTLIELEKAKQSRREARILHSLARQRRGRPRILPLETFQIVAHWYHFAILALANTRGFCSSPAWIARRLGIKPLDAKFAVSRLLSTGLLEQRGEKLCAVEDAHITTTDDFRSAAIQENHRQHLQLAEKALREIDVTFREFNNLTLTMNPADLPRAKRRIREFVDEFNREMERERGQEIYQLNVQFYPLSKPEQET